MLNTWRKALLEKNKNKLPAPTFYFHKNLYSDWFYLLSRVVSRVVEGKVQAFWIVTDINGEEYKAATLQCELFYALQSHTGSFLFLKVIVSFQVFPYHQSITLTSTDTVSPIPGRQHFSSGSSFLFCVYIPNFTTFPLSVLLSV